MTGATIHWTPAMLKAFKKAIAEASEKKKDVFVFDGHEFVLGYARYLAMYLGEQFGEGETE